MQCLYYVSHILFCIQATWTKLGTDQTSIDVYEHSLSYLSISIFTKRNRAHTHKKNLSTFRKCIFQKYNCKPLWSYIPLGRGTTVRNFLPFTLLQLRIYFHLAYRIPISKQYKSHVNHDGGSQSPRMFKCPRGWGSPRGFGGGVGN